jgi:hypothetical protein
MRIDDFFLLCVCSFNHDTLLEAQTAGPPNVWRAFVIARNAPWLGRGGFVRVGLHRVMILQLDDGSWGPNPAAGW